MNDERGFMLKLVSFFLEWLGHRRYGPAREAFVKAWTDMPGRAKLNEAAVTHVDHPQLATVSQWDGI